MAIKESKLYAKMWAIIVTGLLMYLLQKSRPPPREGQSEGEGTLALDLINNNMTSMMSPEETENQGSNKILSFLGR